MARHIRQRSTALISGASVSISVSYELVEVTSLERDSHVTWCYGVDASRNTILCGVALRQTAKVLVLGTKTICNVFSAHAPDGKVFFSGARWSR